MNPFAEGGDAPQPKLKRARRRLIVGLVLAATAVLSGTAGHEFDIDDLFIVTWFSLSGLAWMLLGLHWGNFRKGKMASVHGAGHAIIEEKTSPIDFWYSSILMGLIHVGFGVLFFILGCYALADAL